MLSGEKIYYIGIADYHMITSVKKEIALQSGTFEYVLRKSTRARGLTLTVYCDGSIFVTAPFARDEHTVEDFIIKKSTWLSRKIQYFKSFSGTFPIRKGKNSRKEYLETKEKARALAAERLTHFNTFYQYTYKNIRIKNQKTRWGSCSKRGNLNFNYKIAFLPPEYADYIIVHELCHLGEFNHSRNFWQLVARTIPNYRHIRRELQKNSIRFY